MGADRLRARLAGGQSQLMPGVWDALSAKLARDAGYSSLFLSGYAVSGTLLGLADVGHLTQTEMAEVARRVCAAVPDIDVVVDADTGYGNALNTIRTVELWRQAGAAGIFLEDQVWPKRCGHMSGKLVIEREDWLAKLRAACDRNEELYVTARTDARAAMGLEEAIERAKMARDTGADAVFIEAPESVDEMVTIASALGDVTLVANMVESGRTPLLTVVELAELGFHLVVSPLSLLFSAVHAIQLALQELTMEGSLRARLDKLVDFEAFTDLVGLPAHLAEEIRYH